MNKGIIGRKVGMTQVFEESGAAIPVTLIEAGPCAVTQVKTPENDGYAAVQLGFEDIPEKKLSRPEAGHLKASGACKKHLHEFRLDDISPYKVGDTVSASVFEEGERVDITGVTKGRGYTGSIKRWNHHTLGATHGVGPIHREVGSMGSTSTPARVFKNKKMAGQYGNEQVTVQNQVIVKIDAEHNLIAVKGAVPGANGGIVTLVDTVKKS